MKKLLIVLSLILLTVGCSNNQKEETEWEEILKENNYIIVDVRTKEEYDEGHVVDAVNIPYDEIKDADLDKEKTIVVYCKSGHSSSVAYNNLKVLCYYGYKFGADYYINL